MVVAAATTIQVAMFWEVAKVCRPMSARRIRDVFSSNANEFLVFISILWWMSASFRANTEILFIYFNAITWMRMYWGDRWWLSYHRARLDETVAANWVIYVKRPRLRKLFISFPTKPNVLIHRLWVWRMMEKNDYYTRHDSFNSLRSAHHTKKGNVDWYWFEAIDFVPFFFCQCILCLWVVRLSSALSSGTIIWRHSNGDDNDLSSMQSNMKNYRI